ncbi:MAG: hypothetical protein E6K17_03190 [Methanobacteriota archaeon]|nr:MAG: hypothetical protein E6K17_03190 [Euryarchaeota archaeon]
MTLGDRPTPPPSNSQHARFTERERRLVRRLSTPARTQAWLRGLPYNYEERGETLRTFRVVARLGTAHCLEAALSAATVLEDHGYPPWLLDLESIDDLDHVLFLYRHEGRWGTVAKSRDPGLFGRRSVFRSLRDLVWSYFDPYIDLTGRINGYGVLDLRTLRRIDWRLSGENVWAVQRALIEMPHRRVRSSDARYAQWHRRYVEFRRRFPDRKPVYYARRETWL